MTDEIETAIERLERARQMVADLCEGKQRWVMHIPADPQRDPDLVIVSGIDSALVALRALAGSIAELGIPGPEECTCHAAYKDRGLVAPDCAYHAYEDLFKALRALGRSEVPGEAANA